MLRFNSTETKALNDFLYNSYIHDAKLENLSYNHIDNNLRINAFNPIFNVNFKFVFWNVETVFATKGDWLFGNTKEINSLTVENDFLYLRKYIPKYDKNIEDFLYLVFQTFSGDEIHVVCKEISVNVA